MKTSLPSVIKSLDNYKIPVVIHDPTPDQAVRANVILAHGIFSDKDESGRFVRQAKFLTSHGYRVIRFDFRGHGNHPITAQDITLSGMIIDAKSVLNYVKKNYSESLSVVASSFGAGIILLYLQTIKKPPIKKLILLNPVVDYDLTILRPTGSVMKEIFSNEHWEELIATGYMTPMPDRLPEFRLSEAFINDMRLMRPYKIFEQLNIPTRVIHGSKDTAVPYEIAMTYSLRSPNVDFKIVKGSDHAFVGEPYESKSFELILEWLNE